MMSAAAIRGTVGGLSTNGAALMQTIDTLPAKRAAEAILAGRAPANLRVGGHLKLTGPRLTRLPDGLAVETLDLSGCTALRELPPGLRVRRLTLDGCTALERLPAGLRCYELQMRQTAIAALPDDLRVEYRLDLTGSGALAALPRGLKVGVLVLRDCAQLTALPDGLAVYFLDVAGCARLAHWPPSAAVEIGCLNARGCRSLTALPDGLANLAWIDLADTGIAALPESLRGVPLRWRGVPVDERIVFRPESIAAGEVLDEANAERRRVLLERMGYDRFIAQAGAEVLDRDTDPGGARQLLRVSLRDDEPLVCVAVRCPSTARQYVIRVPPAVRTCRQAAAWIAGFDDPDDYRPLAET
jgi:hypothetical protein